MKHLVIIPAYNEAKKIGFVIVGVKKVVPQADIVVVNDGSSDDTATVAARHKVCVLTHEINRGLGGAIGTGLFYARKNNYETAVTIDADGQHDPKDLLSVLSILEHHTADVVIGNRMHSKNAMPLDRKISDDTSILLVLITIESMAFLLKPLNPDWESRV